LGEHGALRIPSRQIAACDLRDFSLRFGRNPFVAGPA